MTTLVQQEQPLPIDDRPVRRIGYAILLATFGLFGGWAAFAPLDSAAVGSGVVTVQGYRKTVQHLEGGIVRRLYVHDGDQVKAGDPLIELDTTQASSEQEALHSQMIATEALEARLIAERDNKDRVIFAPAGDDPRVREAQANEEHSFQARRTARLGEEEVLNKRVVQLEEQMRGLQAVIAGKQSLIASHREEINDLQALLKDGYVDKLRLRDQEREQSRLETEIAEHRSELARASLQAGETRLQVIQLRKDFAREVADKLAEAQTMLYELRERLSTANDRLKRTLITAPEAGMVMGMSVHTVGGVIGQGTPLLDIVPAGEPLVVEVQLSPLDIDRVQVGKPAKVRFSAFQSAITPVVDGVLTRVSADRLVNDKTGTAYYLGRVELTEQARKDLGTLVLVPGMPAEVMINTGERTLLNYLLQPATNALARAMNED